jgi:hypothetical protein
MSRTVRFDMFLVRVDVHPHETHDHEKRQEDPGRGERMFRLGSLEHRCSPIAAQRGAAFTYDATPKLYIVKLLLCGIRESNPSPQFGKLLFYR